MIKDYYSKKVSKAFNTWSAKYESEVVPKLVNRGYSYSQLAEQIVEELDLSKQHNVLELGVGTGVLGKEVKQRSNASIIGLDISRDMLDQASTKKVYDYLINSSAEEISLADECIHSIYTSFMFHSVLNQQKALNEMYRVLKENGNAIIVDLFPKRNDSAWSSFIKGYFHSLKYEYGAPANYKTVASMFKLLSKTQFKITTHGQLGADKDYVHYFIKLKKGGS